MRISQTFALLTLCLLQYAVASTNAVPMDVNKNGGRTNLRRTIDRTDEIQKQHPGAPIASRSLKEDESGYNMDNLNTDNINIDEYTQRPLELFSTPITEWTTEDWILFGIIFLLLSCLLSCLAKIGCGACNLLNCLTCYCCYYLCCGDPDAGSYIRSS
mmetsp:Transcript_20302/g.49786  ORF Transcript_20302/g.49786 Transcript_20302/m.49786 type:complete len:158 (-) Transcript_20302:2558-3031(-)